MEVVRLFSLGILAHTFGNFLLHFGKNLVLFALGTGPNFGPKMALKKSLNLHFPLPALNTLKGQET